MSRIIPLFFPGGTPLGTDLDLGSSWQYLFIVETAPESQYDLLIKLARDKVQVPHALLCLTGTSKKLHGFKDRPWVSAIGNLHLSAFLAPDREVQNFGVGFTILAAVSVLETLDRLKGLKKLAALKWVNDILINEEKVAGVLAHTQSQGGSVSAAILGIGLNVETTPIVERDPFVPGVTSLRDIIPNPYDCNLSMVFNELIRALERNYSLLVGGGFQRLLDTYRERSMVLNRDVIIHDDSGSADPPEPISGRVSSIGDNLELYLSDRSEPITKGRLILHDGPGR